MTSINIINVDIKNIKKEIQINDYSEDHNKQELTLVTDKKLSELYHEYQLICEPKEIKHFVYKCLILDFIAIFLYSYELLENFMKIENYYLGILYTMKYFTSVFNGVLYVFYIILCTDEEKKKEIETQNERLKNDLDIINENITVKSYLKQNYEKFSDKNYTQLIDAKQSKEEESKKFDYVTLNNPQIIVRWLYLIKIFTWFLKYFSYILYMTINTSFNIISFFSIFVLVVDYYQYFHLKFYYKVILRSENIKQNYLKIKKNIKQD